MIAKLTLLTRWFPYSIFYAVCTRLRYIAMVFARTLHMHSNAMLHREPNNHVFRQYVSHSLQPKTMHTVHCTEFETIRVLPKSSKWKINRAIHFVYRNDTNVCRFVCVHGQNMFRYLVLHNTCVLYCLLLCAICNIFIFAVTLAVTFFKISCCYGEQYQSAKIRNRRNHRLTNGWYRTIQQ